MSICLSVSLSVCLSDDNFGKPWLRNFVFAHSVYLHGIWVKFVHKGHRVNVKVTEAKKVANAYSCIDQLRSAIFIGTRQMAPQTTPRGWSGLRLESMFVWISYRIAYTVSQETSNVMSQGSAATYLRCGRYRTKWSCWEFNSGERIWETSETFAAH